MLNIAVKSFISMAFVFALSAQDREYDRVNIIDPGSMITIRTIDYINSDRADGRIFRGSVAEDVRGENGRIAIPRGAPVELVVRVAPDNDLIIDLDSVVVGGERYGIRADANRIESERRRGVGENRRTGEYVGGGAVVGAIIGAI